METPPLRVSRAVSACARCRGAKTRCDGKLPACSSCERVGKANECSSANDQFAKGKERSYVASLESRVERLQKQISQCRQHQNASLSPPSAGSGAGVIKRTPRKEATDVDDLVSDFGYLSVNATASGYHGFTQEMSFARLVLTTASVSEMPQASICMLPPREFATGLVQECIQKIFVIYPVLSGTMIFGSMEAAYRHNGRYCPPQDCWNARMVLAIASLCRSQTKGDVQYQNAISHAAVALVQREAVLQPGSIATVQATLLLVIYSMMDPSHFSSRYLIGVAARVMVDIGLHQDPAADEENRLKPAQLELRRRIFYCVYALDRVISMTHVRCFSFSDDSVNVLQPQSGFAQTLGQFVTQSSADPAQEVIKFRQIQSSAFQALFGSNRAALTEPWTSRTQLLRNLRDWVSGLAESTPESLKQLLYSEMYYLDVLILLPPGGNHNLGSYGTALLFEYCVGFARNTWSMCDRSWDLSYCSSVDLLRTYFVAGTLISILRDSSRISIFDYPDSQSPPAPASGALPPLQRSGSPEKVAQAITAITHLDQVMVILGRKFGHSSSYNSFKHNSASVLRELYAMPQQGPSPAAPGPENLAVAMRPTYAHPTQWTHRSEANGYFSRSS